LADVLTINGATINLVTFNAQVDRLIPFAKGGTPELHFSRLLGPLAALPDAWSGKSVTLTMFSGTLVFSGSVVGYVDRYMDGLGWCREYRAMGLRNLADYVPMTDSNTLTDTAIYNLPGDDPNFIGSRSGLTVGAIVSSILTMSTNAVALNAVGVGGYTSLGPPTLPAATVADLGTLTVIPPSRCCISGERILQTIESFIQQWHPNHWLNVEADGKIRIRDMRLASNNTLTLGGDARLGMPSLTRDYSDSYSQIEVRGNTIATPVVVQTTPWEGSSAADGGLAEDFAHDGLTNAQAKTAWTPEDYQQPSIGGMAQDFGSCTVSDTTHVVVTSQDAALTWTADYWAQGGSHAAGQLWLFSDVIPGIGQLYSARIVANTALTAAGTSILTLDRALPALTFNSYQIWGLAQGAAVVYRRYKVTNASVAAAMLNYFPYPVPIRASTGLAGGMTSTPTGIIQWSNGGTPPYFTTPMGITVDPVNGLIYFDRPTALTFGNTKTEASNVGAFLPIATGALATYAPSSSTYSGTLYTVEGIQRRKVITSRDWRDASNTANMATFATEFLDSVKDVVVEGVVPYLGTIEVYMTGGQAVSIAGSGYTTGWESLALPVVSVEVVFQNAAQGTSYVTQLHLSNRRGRYTADQHLRPSITGMQIGGGFGTMGGAPMGIAVNPFTGAGQDWSAISSASAAGERATMEGLGNVLTPDQAPVTNTRQDWGDFQARDFSAVINPNGQP
jgi:hypothetical protein